MTLLIIDNTYRVLDFIYNLQIKNLTVFNIYWLSIQMAIVL